MRVRSTILAWLLFVSGSSAWRNEGSAQKISNTSELWHALSSRLGLEYNEHEPIKCGLPVVSAAFALRDSVGADAKALIMQVLQRPTLQKSVVVGSFRIHYDTVGENTPALLDNQGVRIEGTYNKYIDSVGSMANYVRRYEIDTLGYSPPPADSGAGGGNEYDIYIVKWIFSPGIDVYGSTTPEGEVAPGSRRWTSFLTIHNDFAFVRPARGQENRGLPGLRVTLAHEFHHAVQLGGYAWWLDHQYFYELTSTWLEDVLYSEVNDYDQYLPAHFSHPERSFTAFDFSGVIQYGRCIWGHFVAKKYGRDAMRRTWELIRAVQPLLAMDSTMREHNSTFGESFAEWTKWNHFTGVRDSSAFYPEGVYYPLVAMIPRPYAPAPAPPTQAGSVQASPLGAAYLGVTVSGRTDTLVIVFADANFDAAIGGFTSPESYIFELSRDRLGATSDSTKIGLFFTPVGGYPNWVTWFILGHYVSAPPIQTRIPGTLFPNPFVVGGTTAAMQIPVSVDSMSTALSVNGTLYIFTSSMDLVYSANLTSGKSKTILFGPQVFTWDGRTNRGDLARSGIYYFVLDLEEHQYRGKFAVIRK